MTKTCSDDSGSNGRGNERNSPPNPAPIRVMLVDDSMQVRARIAESVSEMDGVVVVGEAADVPSATQMLEECRPDVLVLDIEMPGPSGMDFLKIVRARGLTPVVIMLSIYNHPRLRQVCLDLGADYYFTKLTEFQRPAEVCRDLALGRREDRPVRPEDAKE